MSLASVATAHLASTAVAASGSAASRVLPTVCAAKPLIAFGRVWHKRLRPAEHRFAYPTFFLLLPMRTLQQQPEAAGVLGWNRRAYLSFYDADHGDGRDNPQNSSLAWVEALLQAQGIHDAAGEIWLQCYPRVLGYAFKPVSFWYCHTTDGHLRAIVVEVNNTFGERHIYLLDEPKFDQTLCARKVFHVSPFCSTQGHYQFKFKKTSANDCEQLSVQVDYDDGEGPLLLTGLMGQLEPLTQKTRHKTLWQYPLMSVAVIVRIHWHALQLWFKRVPFFKKPAPPAISVSRSTSQR